MKEFVERPPLQLVGLFCEREKTLEAQGPVSLFLSARVKSFFSPAAPVCAWGSIAMEAFARVHWVGGGATLQDVYWYEPDRVPLAQLRVSETQD